MREGHDSRMLRRSTAGCSYGEMALWLAGVLILAVAEAQAMPRTVRLMCKHAYDRELCLTSLAAYPEAATSGPRGLATIGIHNAIGEVSSFYSYTGSMRSTSDGAGEDSALAVCQSILLDAQDNMQLSIDTLAALNQLRFKEQMADALTWLSSALTDHTTCLDGVSEKAGGTKGNLIKARAGAVTTMLSNAVSLVAAIGSFGMNGDHSRRRRRRCLLADSLVYELDRDEFPAWMRAGERKLMQSATNNLTIVDAVVAKDGSGQYQSIQAAIDAAPQNNAKKWVIGVKKGVYSEYVVVPKSAKNLVLFGDGSGKTIITGDKSVVGSNVTTFATATMAVLAPNFLGRDFTVRNTAGASNHQAVALKVQGDKSAFWRCSIEGYQDTLYTHSNRQFFKDCTISGTVDFVFGNAAAVFQSCTLLGRLPLAGQQNTFTAQGRTTSSQNTGLSFQNCLVDAASELKNAAGSTQVVMSYLGRPWKEFSRTVFLTCTITNVIASEGWLPWNGKFALATLFYGEYKNVGAGAATASRVAWATQIQDAIVANQFTVNPFLMGANWLPQTSIDYSAALYSN